MVKNIPLWLEQFPNASTKVTISSADIPYIKDSVLHLYSLGIHEVNINCVFENVWEEGDDKLFEEQLMLLADAIIDGGYYEDYACSFFTEHMGKPMDCHLQNQNWCGAGKMLAVDAEGNFYPCTRFAQYSLRSKKAWIIGNIHDGIDQNKLRPFLTLVRSPHKSASIVKWLKAVPGVRERTMMPPIHRPSTSVPQPSARCTRQGYTPTTIIGTNFIVK